MRFLRVLQMVGWALIAVAIPFLVFTPPARPSLHRLGGALGVRAVLGVAAKVVFRLVVPSDRRLELEPAGMAGVCIVSGAAGATHGSVEGAVDSIGRYTGPAPEPIEAP